MKFTKYEIAFIVLTIKEVNIMNKKQIKNWQIIAKQEYSHLPLPQST